MEESDKKLCKLLTAALRGETISENWGKEEWEKIFRLGEKNGVASLIYDAGKGMLPEEIEKRGQRASFEMAVRYFRIARFTLRVLHLLEAEEIRAVVLKGVGLNVLYPREEARKLSDVDLYVFSRKDFERSGELLQREGYLRGHDHSGYHQEYRGPLGDKKYLLLLELHHQVVQELPVPHGNQRVEAIFRGLAPSLSTETVLGEKIPVLPETENAFYLLLHMLGHFITAGFSLRNLCDWVVFLRERGAAIDENRYLQYVDSLGLRGFSETITGACRRYLGLSEDCCPFLGTVSQETAEALLEDLLGGGEFGRYDSTRVWFAVSAGKKPGPMEYFRQLRRETKVRYPQLAGAYPLLPLLWIRVAAGVVKNNRRERHSSMNRVLKTFHRRSTLSRSMGLFQPPRSPKGRGR